MNKYHLVLRNEAGVTIEESFDSLRDAAVFCSEYPDYGITLFGDYEEAEWRLALDNAFGI